MILKNREKLGNDVIAYILTDIYVFDHGESEFDLFMCPRSFPCPPGVPQRGKIFEQFFFVKFLVDLWVLDHGEFIYNINFCLPFPKKV